MEIDSKEIKKLKKIHKQQKKVIKKLNIIHEEIDNRHITDEADPYINEEKNDYLASLYKDVVLKIIDNFAENNDSNLGIDSRIKNVYDIRHIENSSDGFLLSKKEGDIYFNLSVDFNNNNIYIDFGYGTIEIKENIEKYKDRFKEIYCEREKQKLEDILSKILNDTKLSRIESLNNLL